MQVQRWRHDPISCITHYSTRLHVFRASQIPEPPADASGALARGQGLCPTPPNKQVLHLIPAFYHSIDRSRVPDRETFNLAADEAAKAPPSKKSQELKNISDGRFFDIVAQVARSPYDMADYVTLWITDFTENPAFYHFSEEEGADEPYADPMGYGGAETQRWDGPSGKKSLQVTCWEPHATIIRSKVTKGSYVSLRNVQVRFGRNGANLEGFLRGDKRNPKKVNVEVLNPMEDPENIDERLKALIRRKRDFMREKKKQSRKGASKESKKRKGGEGEVPENSKTRRAKKRAGMHTKEQAKEKRNEEPMQEDRTKLNPLGPYRPFTLPKRNMASSIPLAFSDLSNSILRERQQTTSHDIFPARIAALRIRDRRRGPHQDSSTLHQPEMPSHRTGHGLFPQRYREIQRLPENLRVRLILGQ